MEQITVSVATARAALGIGNTKIYQLIGQGLLSTMKVGRRTLITTESIRKLVADATIESGEAR